MKKSSYELLVEEAVSAKAFNFYYLTCGSFETQIATLAPISKGDTVYYKDEEEDRDTAYVVKKIYHRCDVLSTDHRIPMTFLECEELQSEN